jgi:glycosyltransferase involved in cell wall biosynthesis
MKIAIIAQPIDRVLPPNPTSIGIWSYEIAKRLAEYSNVSVYTGGYSYRIQRTRLEKVNYISVPVIFDRYVLRFLNSRYNLFIKNKQIFAHVLYYLIYILLISFDVKFRNYDVVHIYNFSQFGLILRLINPKVKIVLNMRCEWLTQLDKTTIKERLEKVNRILGCSEYITDKISKRFPIYTNSCKTILNGVDINQFRYKDTLKKTENQTFNILYVGRISPEKGIHVLLESLSEIIRFFPKIKAKLIGFKGQLPYNFLVALDGSEKIIDLHRFYKSSSPLEYYNCLKKIIDERGLSSNVEFLGTFPYSKMVEFYNWADLLVNPSFSESFGRSLIEAMACETPVIVSRVGGMTEIVEHGKTGILFEAGNSKELLNSMTYLLNNRQLMKKMGVAGRMKVSSIYSWDKIAKDLLKIYYKI